jgi:hypothetical protein
VTVGTTFTNHAFGYVVLHLHPLRASRLLPILLWASTPLLQLVYPLGKRATVLRVTLMLVTIHIALLSSLGCLSLCTLVVPLVLLLLLLLFHQLQPQLLMALCASPPSTPSVTGH